MTELEKAARMALYALTYIHAETSQEEDNLIDGAITALRQALANEALDRMAENARELGLDYDAKPDERLMKMPDEPVAWVERWHGSGPDRGWWVWEAGLTHGNSVAYIGEGEFAERLASLIVEKHNAAITRPQPAKETFCPDPHDPANTTRPQPAARSGELTPQIKSAYQHGFKAGLETAQMRMPKVGDRVICIEDESLATVESLTGGGSPDIKFDDGSRGTYLLREFAELFRYADTQPAAWVGLTASDLSEIPPSAYEGAIWADAKLRKKNGGGV